MSRQHYLRCSVGDGLPSQPCAWTPFSPLPPCPRTASPAHLPWGWKHRSAFWNNNYYKHSPFLKHVKTGGRLQSKAEKYKCRSSSELSKLPWGKLFHFGLSQEEAKILRFRILRVTVLGSSARKWKPEKGGRICNEKRQEKRAYIKSSKQLSTSPNFQSLRIL